MKYKTGTWSFLLERWSSGMFFVQTKPPAGIFWDKMSDTSFQTASFHSPVEVCTVQSVLNIFHTNSIHILGR